MMSGEQILNFMSTAMLQIGKMSLVASVIIGIVLVVRRMLKNAPRIFSYALWSMVLFRLLCPFSLSSHFSLWNLIPLQEKNVIAVQESMKNFPNFQMNYDEELLPNRRFDSSITSGVQISEQEFQRSDGLSRTEVLTVIWILGIFVVWGVGLVKLARIRKKVSCRMKLCNHVYLVDGISTPFCMGVLKPTIYLPSDISEEECDFILLHELHHIKRGDHIVKLVAFVALCLHWFNPLVWFAFALAGKDMEMSCDEAVIRKMDEDNRSAYAMCLLELSSGKRSLQLSILSFGEGNPEERIKRIMTYKKPTLWGICAALVVCIVVGFTLSTNAAEWKANDTKLEEIAMPEEKKEVQMKEKLAEASEQLYELDCPGKEIESGFALEVIARNHEETLFHAKTHGEDVSPYKAAKKRGVYLDPSSVYSVTSSHWFKKGDGLNGPMDGTCRVTTYYGTKYPQCVVCEEVDYSHPQEGFLYQEHENCGRGIIDYWLNR